MKTEEKINILGNIVYIVIYLCAVGMLIGRAVNGNVCCMFLAAVVVALGVGYVLSVKNERDGGNER